MAIITKLNDVLCVNISKIDNVLKTNVKYFDENTFCPTPTPTPTTGVGTPTPTPTLTRTPTNTPPSVTPTKTPSSTPLPGCIEGTIQKDTNYEYKDCCYPYGQITGTAGGDGLTVCFDPSGTRVNVTAVSPTVACDTGLLTRCCEIDLGYSDVDPSYACYNTKETYYISIPCKSPDCLLDFALGIYTDVSCTTLAPDGYYSDWTNYGTVSGGVFTFNGSC
jgi:hypothetical protein